MFRKSTIRRRQFDGRVVGLAVLALAARAHADGESRAVASTGGAAATGPVSCKAFVGPDADQDCDVDLSDFRLFQACVTGPDAGPPIPECQGMDIDGDGDVDPADAAVFSQCRGGPGLVAEAACEEPGYVPPTSLAKIDEELAAGLITETDALRYKVFAVYGDGRLPHRFGGATFEEGTAVVEQLAEQYGDLPVELRDELTPFVLPPDAPGSWYAASAAAGSTSSAAGDGPPTGSFHQLDVTDGAGKSVAVVKWPTTHALAASAQTVRDAMQGPDGVYAKLVALMGRAPRSDADLDPENNGGDGRYDVYLLPQGSTNFGWTQPASPGFFQGVFFDRTRTSFIVMDVQTIANNFGGHGTALYNRKLRSNIAHEFMHAIQFAFNVSASRSDYWWLGDATATWAEHYMFPNENMEHPDAPDFLRTLDLPLEVDLPDTDRDANRRYGGYLYFFHQVQKHGDSVLRFTYQSAEEADTLTAIDNGVPNGIAENWADFAAANWNDPPVSQGTTSYNYYESSDGLQTGARNFTPLDDPTLSGQQDDWELALSGDGLQPLSAQYFHVKLSDTDIRSLMFANGLTFDLDRGVPSLFAGNTGDETLYATRLSDEERNRLHVLALIKQNGTWSPEAFDLTDVAFAPFCQEATDESVEEIVIIMANARWEDHERDPVTAPGLPSRLFMSNMGCGAWSGTAQYHVKIAEVDEVTTSTANFSKLEFERDTSSLTQIAAGAGQMAFGPIAGSEIIPVGTLAGIAPFGGGYQLANATANWTHTSDYHSGDTNCGESGSGTLQTSDSLGAGFQISPYLYNTLGNASPSLYRSFFINAAFVDADENFTGGCVDGEGKVTNYESPFGLGLAGGYRNLDFGSLIIEPSGNTINETWTINNVTVELHLTSKKIP
jgi:hypothetical protein